MSATARSSVSDGSVVASKKKRPRTDRNTSAMTVAAADEVDRDDDGSSLYALVVQEDMERKFGSAQALRAHFAKHYQYEEVRVRDTHSCNNIRCEGLFICLLSPCMCSTLSQRIRKFRGTSCCGPSRPCTAYGMTCIVEPKVLSEAWYSAQSAACPMPSYTT